MPPREGNAVAEHIFIWLDLAPALHEFGKGLVGCERLGYRPPRCQLVQNARRRLADRTPLPVVRHIGDAVTSEAHAHGDLVTTGRVDLAGLGIERLTKAAPDRALVVVQDDLLVERVGGHRKNLFACSTPSASASISDCVVYR